MEAKCEACLPPPRDLRPPGPGLRCILLGVLPMALGQSSKHTEYGTRRRRQPEEESRAGAVAGDQRVAGRTEQTRYSESWEETAIRAEAASAVHTGASCAIGDPGRRREAAPGSLLLPTEGFQTRGSTGAIDTGTDTGQEPSSARKHRQARRRQHSFSVPQRGGFWYLEVLAPSSPSICSEPCTQRTGTCLLCNICSGQTLPCISSWCEWPTAQALGPNPGPSAHLPCGLWQVT
nr:uncharacterized protein LOC105875282 [Microcebus murinus]